MGFRGLPAASAAAIILFFSAAAAADAPAPALRFVSLASATANGRHGPGLEHRIDWVYQRQGLPLEVVAESGPWRRVRDPDGAEVWIHMRNLGPKRTVLVQSAGREGLALRREPRAAATVTAYLDNGVTADLTACNGGWRRITVQGRVGWAQAEKLWGAADCSGL